MRYGGKDIIGENIWIETDRFTYRGVAEAIIDNILWISECEKIFIYSESSFDSMKCGEVGINVEKISFLGFRENMCW